MEIQCKHCRKQFSETEADTILRAKINPTVGGKMFAFPNPTLCPDCRQQRRMSYRNERLLYSRTCDKTGKQIISVYSPDKPYVVYGSEAWWKDDWDAREYGQDFDFDRPFFEQFDELAHKVPRPNLVNMHSENSEYTNHSAYNKNCYLCFNTGWTEDSLYVSNYSIRNKDCVDCLAIHDCEQCYFCVNTTKSSFSSYLLECDGCSDSRFCFDCRNCQNCYGCYNLRQKQYCIYNKQYSKEEYDVKLKELLPRTAIEYERAFNDFIRLISEKAIHKATITYAVENASGDYLTNCKNVHHAFYLFNSEDVRYCYDGGELKDCMDIVEPFIGELQYETHACNQGTRLVGCSKCYETNDLMYCQYCWHSHDLFGCIGFKRNEYCILNKQYSKEEYEALVPKIIEHMIRGGEWGEFFPMKHSPFGYNESVANEYYPLSKEEIAERGLRWNEYDPPPPNITSMYNASDVPEHIEDVTDEILNHAILCEKTNRPFKIMEVELEYYRKNSLPLPRKHPDARHYERFSLRNERKLWDRTCTKCGRSVRSTHAPLDTPSSKPIRPRNVYCDECYVREVY